MADELTLTLRLHDPKEKAEPKLSATWVTMQIPREDLQLSNADFTAKYLTPALDKFAHFRR